MLNEDPMPDQPQVPMPLLAAADLQDSLMVAANDLDRLQRLLTDATETLMQHFYGASSHVSGLQQDRLLTETPEQALVEIKVHLAGAVTALQFQDMASQLIAHTQRRLRNCTDRLARDVMGDDDDDGEAVVEEPPLRPNPVTQDEMDAGSIELF